jgi:hypothetical protein
MMSLGSKKSSLIVLAVLVLLAGAYAFFQHQLSLKRDEGAIDPSTNRATAFENWRYREVCPPGHKTEIQLGQVHLRLELRIIATLNLVPSQEIPNGCPTSEIVATSIYLYGLNPELADLYQRHKLRLKYLELSDPAYKIVSPKLADTGGQSSIKIDGGLVTDVTATAAAPANVKGKIYRLEHAVRSAEPAEPPIELVCSGDPISGVPRRRDCFARYVLDGDLMLRYEFRQDDRDEPYVIRKLSPVGPIAEPAEFLAVDANVRALVREMRVKK